MGKKKHIALATAQSASVNLAALPDITEGTGFSDWAAPSDKLSYNPTDTLGASGTQFFAGILTGEEYNAELSGDALYRTVDHMWRSCPQIAALMAVLTLPLTQGKRWIQAASDDPLDVEVAQFVQDNLFGGLTRPFSDIEEESTRAWLRDGVSVLEKVYSKPDPEDGKVRLRKLAPRPAKTIKYWFPNQDDELDRIVQLVYVPDETGTTGSFQYREIVGPKIVRFTHQQEANNFLGISVLRPAYKPNYMLDQLERLACVAAERMAAGVPVFSEPQGPVQPADRATAAAALSSLHAHEKMYLIEPYGWAFRFESATGMNLMPLIEYFSLQIVRCVLAQFLNLDRGGSYALSLDISGFFLQSLQSKLTYRLERWNSEAIRPLVDMNFDVERYPTMQADPLDKRDVDKFLVGLAAVLPWITKDDPTENAVRQLLGLPDKEVVTAPDGTTPTTVDTDSQGQGASNEDGTGDATTDETQQNGAETVPAPKTAPTPAPEPTGATLSALPAWLSAEVETLLAEPPSGISAETWREIVLSSAALEAA